MPRCPPPIRAALAQLGVDRLAFGIHQSAFPAGELDCGYGSPHGATGRALLAFVAGLGFDTVQLGPHGQISAVNPSPYDGTAFARSLLHLDLAQLSEEACGALLSPDAIAAVVQGARAPGGVETLSDQARADPACARPLVDEVVTSAHAAFASAKRAGRAEHVSAALARFVAEQADWLEADAMFELLAAGLGHDDPTRFDAGLRALLAPDDRGRAQRKAMGAVMAEPLERVQLGQWLLHAQASALRAWARSAGLALFGDLQVGFSHRDRFLRADAFHPHWRLGAPPSRTNPDGQPWGYPVLHPDQLDDPDSPARRLLQLRFEDFFASYDGLRIDHPHGLVCPWIYRADDPDPLHAVRHGARAFESPDARDSELSRWAIARVEDIDPKAEHAWDETRVRALDAAQVARFSRLFDALIGSARARGIATSALCAEVLSTCPAPLLAVLARHGLGRFRVTQKADVDNPKDVYRTDQARPADWVMLGNHDTPSIFVVAEGWLQDGSAEARAHYLAARLVPDAGQRAQAVERYRSSAWALVQAHLADLFLSEARNVFVYFVDLFGERAPFNRPGIVHPDNWTLRLPSAFAELHRARCQRGEALDLPLALSDALRALPGQAQLADAVAAFSPRAGG